MNSESLTTGHGVTTDTQPFGTLVLLLDEPLFSFATAGV